MRFGETFPPIIQSDLNHLIIGELLGRGVYRHVYEFRPNINNEVIKLEITDSTHFANVAEWRVWEEVKDTKWEKWFAPCSSISQGGSVLVQARTKPLDKLPRNIPSFMADIKLENWGLFRGRPVVHDYANHRFYSNAIKAARVVPLKILTGGR